MYLIMIEIWNHLVEITSIQKLQGNSSFSFLSNIYINFIHYVYPLYNLNYDH